MNSLAGQATVGQFSESEQSDLQETSLWGAIAKITIFSVGLFCSISPVIAVSLFSIGLWHFAHLGWLPFDRSHREELILFRWGIIGLLGCNVCWNAMRLGDQGLRVVMMMGFFALFLGSKGLEFITHLILAHASAEELTKLDSGFTVRAISFAIVFFLPFLLMQGILTHLRTRDNR